MVQNGVQPQLQAMLLEQPGDHRVERLPVLFCRRVEVDLLNVRRLRLERVQEATLDVGAQVDVLNENGADASLGNSREGCVQRSRIVAKVGQQRPRKA